MMKKYYKITNGEFDGFYDEDMINDSESFKEINLEEYKKLLEIKIGQEIKILKNGEIGLYTYPICTKNFIKKIFNWETEEWEEGATLEEQRQYWLNKSLKISRKIEEYKNIGLAGGQEYIALEKELETYKKNYINACQDEAIVMDNHMSSTKQVK